MAQRTGQDLGSLSSASDAAASAYADQLQRMQDFIKQQQLQASGSAKQAGTQASEGASGLGVAVLIAAVVIGIALVIGRK